MAVLRLCYSYDDNDDDENNEFNENDIDIDAINTFTHLPDHQATKWHLLERGLLVSMGLSCYSKLASSWFTYSNKKLYIVHLVFVFIYTCNVVNLPYVYL